MRHRAILPIKVFASIFVVVLSVFAQQPQGSTAPTSYDVVSIKPESDNPTAIGIHYTATGFEAYAVTLADLLKEAYGLPDVQLVKGASAIKPKYHIVAKLSENDMAVMRSLSPEQLAEERQRLLQQILRDRFQLTTHHASSRLAIYSLELSKRGLKLSAVPSETENGPKGAKGTNVSKLVSESFFADGRIKGVFSMEQLARILTLSKKVDSDASDRKVIDNTGLKGKYIIDLAWTGPSNNPPPMVSADTEIYGSASSALEQVGLRLVPETIDADSVVVDHATLPDTD